ncbi:major facilitator superfamily domain-containing protein [Dichotomocladium elegans]|nr:major facilitator superfamily domain-containing protein [Dichotomocladium elegans]
MSSVAEADLSDQKTIRSTRSNASTSKIPVDGQIISANASPNVIDGAPFPVLGSVQEIVRIITRESAVASVNQEQTMAGDQEKGNVLHPWEVPLETEGWRSPGWLCVISSFLVNFVVFGNTFAWGNFQRLYLENVFADQTDAFRIAFIGTLANSVLLACGLFLTPIIQRIGFRSTMVIGAIVCPLGMVLSSVTTALGQLYVTQGLMIGLGGAFVFSPSLTLPSQWFTRNRGLATGIAVSGSGIGGVALSPMTERLIALYGYRMALRILGATYFGILVIAVVLAKSRYLPPKSTSSSSFGLDNFWDKSMASRKFLLLAIFSFIVPFGYTGPFFLTPTYVTSVLGGTSAQGSAMLSVMSGMNSVCRISLGLLADRTGRLNTMFACTFLAGIFVMAIWEFSTTYSVFAVFSVLYGLTGGGFVSLFPVVTAEIVGVQHIQKGIGFCYFLTMPGSLLGSPFIGLLQKNRGWTAAIQFAGVPSVAAGLVMLVLRFMVNKKILARV